MSEMVKETLRIKVVENGITIRSFFMDFKEWQKVHRKGGGSPYVVKIDDKTNIEISLRDEKVDSLIERRLKAMGEKEELKNWEVAIVRVYRSEFIKAKTEEEARGIANQRCGSNEGVGVIEETDEEAEA